MSDSVAPIRTSDPRRSPTFHDELPGLTIVVVGFVVSRIIVALLGVRFTVDPVFNGWQTIVPEATREDFLGSIYRSHKQPPLFNAVVAAVRDLTPFPLAGTFQALYLALGIVLVGALYLCCRELGFVRWSAIVVALLIACAPTTILYENFADYTYPVAVLLSVALYFAVRYAARRRPGDAVGLLAATAAVALSRPSYHLVWWLGILVAVLVLAGRHRRGFVVAVGWALVLLLLVGGVYVKNQRLYGMFTASSWAGMNLHRVAVQTIPEREVKQLVKDGTLSPLALVQPFQPYETYSESEYATPPDRPTGRPVLDILSWDPADEVHKRDESGFVVTPNFDYAGYVGIDKQYLSDDIAAIKARPFDYLGGVGKASLIYFNSPANYQFVEPNRGKIADWDQLWRFVVDGELGAFASPTNSPITKPGRSTGALAILLFVVIAGAGAIAGFQVLGRRRRLDGPTGARLFGAYVLVWAVVVGSAFELGENNRFRYEVTPMALVLGAMLVRDLLVRIRLRPSRR